MRRLVLLPAVILALSLTACSKDHKGATSASTTTASASTSVATTSTSVGASTSTTTKSVTTTTKAPTTPSPIIRFSGPSGAVQCNAPTSVELDWETRGATSVKIVLDKTSPYTYSDGAHRALLYLPCDGKAHIYELQATKDGVTSKQTVTVQTKKSV